MIEAVGTPSLNNNINILINFKNYFFNIGKNPNFR